MQVNPVGKYISEVDQAYAAGFLDADGAIMALIERHQEKRYGFRVRICLKVTQKDPTILEWFLETFAVGSIRKNRTTYDWIVRDQQHVGIFLQTVLPYIHVKKLQAQKALQILQTIVKNSSGFRQLATLADSLAQLNVRSKGRRKNTAQMVQEVCSRND